MAGFRFSPATNRAHEIAWRPWGREAFAQAQAEGKPVLLSISAVWCYWCHTMDETSYSDPDVQRVLAEDFIAIRADNDHRPDLNTRYNVGGWPTTAFLTGHGGLIGGATYLPPDQFLSMLAELREAYREDRPQLYDQARDRFRQYRDRIARISAGPEVEQWIVDRVSRRIAGAYDAINGGFGLEPKFPNAPMLQFAAHLYRTTGENFYGEMLRKTLGAMFQGPLFDTVDGGFFRNAGCEDWSDPQMEKLLEDNVALVRVYLDAAILLDHEPFRQVASRTIDYLLAHLYDGLANGFRGSQGAHSDYFALPPSARQSASPPPVDSSCYVNGNAAAVSMLLEAAWKLQRPALLDTALGTLDMLIAAVAGDGLAHTYGDKSLESGAAFLSDWTHLLTALVAAHSYTGRPTYLEHAKSVAVELIDRFFDENHGGFFDIEADPDAIGHLRVRDKPLPENAAAAVGLLKLHQATGDSDFHQIAGTALSAFEESFHEYGEHSAPYGLAVDMLNNHPVEVVIEGLIEHPDALALLSSAARLPCPNLVIKPSSENTGDYPAVAHVCLETLCLPPVSDPDSLAPAVLDMISGHRGPFSASPFEDIFDRLPGT